MCAPSFGPKREKFFREIYSTVIGKTYSSYDELLYIVAVWWWLSTCIFNRKTGFQSREVRYHERGSHNYLERIGPFVYSVNKGVCYSLILFITGYRLHIGPVLLGIKLQFTAHCKWSPSKNTSNCFHRCKNSSGRPFVVARIHIHVIFTIPPQLQSMQQTAL